ncbi:Single-stranded-DNA-specific exonuclease RecJ [Halomicronema hongdechloris C2206]|uniref:Single-stranded-DNA-specific exonuclease RecJ n=1 Tax=Halomicronema hongdechloris C2206 TaxID=1641165 RepID=A0A1Z3HU20_9CYAN|nr:DHHA1 domain-containing protein [Halomicronema hongdechloris]ASC73811.1 Single-stranded-DNA-specific exonuclease RecJ [Halomicronema hongdechloris C2206]
MTSTALLLRALRFLGANVDYAIPSRMQEGYGINERIVDEFYADGVAVILTVDNGIAAVAPNPPPPQPSLSATATNHHHDVPETIPPAHAILNPKLIRPDSPYRGIAGVGVAYILAVCLAQARGQTQDLTAPLLELFTLGTIADLAPLVGVNRRWVRRGLKLLPRSRILGVQALIQVAGLGEEEKALKPEDIGFRLGPRINAVGRISDPQIVIEMLTTDDTGIALERAMQCEQINQHRRELCQRIELEAVTWCEAQRQGGQLDLTRDRLLLIIQPDWHHGVIGIVASRLVERYGVPVFIGTYEDEAHTEIRGSARGIPEFHVFEALQSCDDLLDKYGGHRAAGGFSFPSKHLRQVKSRLVKFANGCLAPEHLKPLVTIDAQARLCDLSLDLYAQIDRLHPCGIENPDPVFWTPAVRLLEQRPIGKGRDHLKLRVTDDSGTELKVLAWRWGDYCPLPEQLDIAYKLRVNAWNGSRTIELELLGVRLPTVTVTPPSPEPAAPTSPPLSDPPSSPPNGDMNALGSQTMATSGATRVDFSYSKRRYSVHIRTDATDGSRQLIIHNPEGQILIVALPQRQGFLGIPGQPLQPIDPEDGRYCDLIRTAAKALELDQKTRWLAKQDALLAAKDSQIQLLSQQVALLTSTLEHLPAEQRETLAALQTSLEQQVNAVQEQEAQITQLQARWHQTQVSPER